MPAKIRKIIVQTDEVRGCPLETFGFATPVTGFYRRFVS